MERNMETIVNPNIAAGMQNYIVAGKAALRARIWFAYGFHLANLDGEASAYSDTLRLAINPTKGDSLKGKASEVVKVARVVGNAFQSLFGAELASKWQSDAHLIQACYLAATASGATTIEGLTDLAEHGDADYTAKEKAKAKAAKAAEAAAKAAEAADALNEATHSLDFMGFDVVPVPVEGSENEPSEATDLTVEERLTLMFSAMDDETLSLARNLVWEEQNRREAAAQDTRLAANG
jgi:hypothetical protein